MKQRITVEDLNSLNVEQKQNLNTFWKPDKFDFAVANICKDIINDEYEDYEFLVGDIKIYNGYRIMLYDLKCINDVSKDSVDFEGSEDLPLDKGAELSEVDIEIDKDDESEEDYNETDEDESFEENTDFCYSRPSAFTKDECSPLLSIGQMLDILSKNSPSDGKFYLYADSDEIFCEMGNASKSNEYGIEIKNDELCDVLWSLIKKLL
ncbi:MAG: hypothetical protein Q8942_20830 [Bacillota bacterium]|nr:hypothetical protein [Bacillota bacterium]